MNLPLPQEAYDATLTYDHSDRTAEQLSTELQLGPITQLTTAGLTEMAFKRLRETKTYAPSTETEIVSQADARIYYNTYSPSANISASPNTGAMKTIAEDVDRIAPPFRLTPQKALRTETVVALQEWEGYVTAVRNF